MPPSSDPEEVVRPSFDEAFRFWRKLGFISFGGPAGQIAIIVSAVLRIGQKVRKNIVMFALVQCAVNSEESEWPTLGCMDDR